jgi:Spy/CpxP family protein refolding chaperone
MRMWCSVLLAVAVSGSCGTAVSAQGFPFQESGRFNGMAILMRHEGVQAELKVTREQNLKFKDLVEKTRTRHQADFDKLEKLEGDERSLAKRNLSKTIIEEVSKDLPKVLTAEQHKRLKEIALQQAGIHALIEPEVQKALKITDEQNKQLKALMAETQKEYLVIRQTRTEDFEGSKKRDHELQRKTMKKAEALLTPDQLKAWRVLRGATFDFERAPYLKADGDEEKKEKGKKENGTKDPAASQPPLTPVDLKEDLSWVARRVEEWQPSREERRFDQIGWAKDIRDALKLAREHNRPVFIHAYNDGRMELGRC